MPAARSPAAAPASSGAPRLSPPLIPINASLTLTVIERYASVDASGLPVTQENRVSKSITVSVHDSRKEVGDMARQFLLDFSDSSITGRGLHHAGTSPTTGRPARGEKASETNEVANNRQQLSGSHRPASSSRR